MDAMDEMMDTGEFEMFPEPAYDLFCCRLNDDCFFATNIMSQFKNHMTSQHQQHEGEWPCAHCGSSLESMNDLYTHLVQNMMTMKKCSLCQITCLHSAPIKHHISIVHDEADHRSISLVDIFVGCGKLARQGGIGRTFLCSCEATIDELQDFLTHIKTCPSHIEAEENSLKDKRKTRKTGKKKTGNKRGRPSTKLEGENGPFSKMIKSAILALRDTRGSTTHTIKKYIINNCKVGEGKNITIPLRQALILGMGIGSLIRLTGKGTTGRFTLGDTKSRRAASKKKKEKEKKKEAAAKKKTALKEKSKKDSPKKSLKKNSPKKSPKKDSPKKSPKKDSPKKSPKKDSPKKSPKKSGPKSKATTKKSPKKAPTTAKKATKKKVSTKRKA